LARSPPLAGRITFSANPHKVALKVLEKVGKKSTTSRKAFNLKAVMSGDRITRRQTTPKGIGFVLDKLSSTPLRSTIENKKTSTNDPQVALTKMNRNFLIQFSLTSQNSK
jgi:hypothetical protein